MAPSTHPEVKAAIRDHTEQMRQKPGPMEVDEMAHSGEEEYCGEWGEAHAVGHSKGQGKAKGNEKTRTLGMDPTKLGTAQE